MTTMPAAAIVDLYHPDAWLGGSASRGSASSRCLRPSATRRFPRELPARQGAAALLLVRHAARAVAELASARATRPELVEVRVERLG
jgi:hypothetical protein